MLYLFDVFRVEGGGHIGLDDPPFDEITTTAHHRRESVDEDVFHGIADNVVAFVVEFSHYLHAFSHHFKIVLERHALGKICERLNGLVGVQGFSVAAEFGPHLG